MGLDYGFDDFSSNILHLRETELDIHIASPTEQRLAETTETPRGNASCYLRKLRQVLITEHNGHLFKCLSLNQALGIMSSTMYGH